MSDIQALCQICGEPMPKGEEVFNFHGYSGPCPKPPLPKEPPIDWKARAERAEAEARAAEEELDEANRQLAELKRGLRNNNSDFELAFLDAYLEHFRTLRAKAEKLDRAEAEAAALRKALREALNELYELIHGEAGGLMPSARYFCEGDKERWVESEMARLSALPVEKEEKVDERP